MASAADRHLELRAPGEPDRSDHVRDPGTSCDHVRATVDRAVPHPAVNVIARIAGSNQLAPKTIPESGKRRHVEFARSSQRLDLSLLLLVSPKPC